MGEKLSEKLGDEIDEMNKLKELSDAGIVNHAVRGADGRWHTYGVKEMHGARREFSQKEIDDMHHFLPEIEEGQIELGYEREKDSNLELLMKLKPSELIALGVDKSPEELSEMSGKEIHELVERSRQEEKIQAKTQNVKAASGENEPANVERQNKEKVVSSAINSFVDGVMSQVSHGGLYESKQEAREDIDKVLGKVIAMTLSGRLIKWSNEEDVTKVLYRLLAQERASRKMDDMFGRAQGTSRGSEKSATPVGTQADTSSSETQQSTSEWRPVANGETVERVRQRDRLESILAAKVREIKNGIISKGMQITDNVIGDIIKAIKNGNPKSSEMSQQDYDEVVERAVRTDGSETEMYIRALDEKLKGIPPNEQMKYLKHLLENKKEERQKLIKDHIKALDDLMRFKEQSEELIGGPYAHWRMLEKKLIDEGPDSLTKSEKDKYEELEGYLYRKSEDFKQVLVQKRLYFDNDDSITEITYIIKEINRRVDSLNERKSRYTSGAGRKRTATGERNHERQPGKRRSA
ncbi:MAG: hypothetical protein LBH36_01500 [Candidatus Nomurabacteria bacterium]|jgi:hypothetical protein|nr:hypothetical protein [Candidatus Nomurabacteria bacterium]